MNSYLERLPTLLKESIESKKVGAKEILYEFEYKNMGHKILKRQNKDYSEILPEDMYSHIERVRLSQETSLLKKEISYYEKDLNYYSTSFLEEETLIKRFSRNSTILNPMPYIKGGLTDRIGLADNMDSSTHVNFWRFDDLDYNDYFEICLYPPNDKDS